MSEIMIETDRILKASETCPDVKNVLRELFPEVFKEEWRDITGEVRPELDNLGGGGYFIRLYHGKNVVAYTGSSGNGKAELKLGEFGAEENYKLVVDGSGDFNILKKS